MSGAIIQLIVLAGVALFLILKLRGVLGSREGFEKPSVTEVRREGFAPRGNADVIEGGPTVLTIASPTAFRMSGTAYQYCGLKRQF